MHTSAIFRTSDPYFKYLTRNPNWILAKETPRKFQELRTQLLVSFCNCAVMSFFLFFNCPPITLYLQFVTFYHYHILKLKREKAIIIKVIMIIMITTVSDLSLWILLIFYDKIWIKSDISWLLNCCKRNKNKTDFKEIFFKKRDGILRAEKLIE